VAEFPRLDFRRRAEPVLVRGPCGEQVGVHRLSGWMFDAHLARRTMLSCPPGIIDRLDPLLSESTDNLNPCIIRWATSDQRDMSHVLVEASTLLDRDSFGFKRRHCYPHGVVDDNPRLDSIFTVRP
jgi:hypothetical protein